MFYSPMAKRKVRGRVNVLRGQLLALLLMLDEEKELETILHFLKSIRGGVVGLESFLLEDFIVTHADRDLEYERSNFIYRLKRLFKNSRV